MYWGVWLRLELGLVLFDKHDSNIVNEWLGKISWRLNMVLGSNVS